MQGIFSLILQPKYELETRDGPSTGSGTFVPKSRSPEVKKTNTLFNMITADQLKDLCKRIDALRRYL